MIQKSLKSAVRLLAKTPIRIVNSATRQRHSAEDKAAGCRLLLLTHTKDLSMSLVRAFDTSYRTFLRRIWPICRLKKSCKMLLDKAEMLVGSALYALAP
jgi:hypothetical protein